MTNTENDTRAEDALTPENVAAEADATTPTTGENDEVAKLADEADHHPRIVIEWGKVTIDWWTHAIGGLHRNDFVMAARVNKQTPGT